VTGVWLTIPKTLTFTALLPWKEKVYFWGTGAYFCIIMIGDEY